jgi:hypothetical protein
MVSQSEYSASQRQARHVVVVAKGRTDLPSGSSSHDHVVLADGNLKVHGRSYKQASTGALEIPLLIQMLKCLFH